MNLKDIDSLDELEVGMNVYYQGYAQIILAKLGKILALSTKFDSDSVGSWVTLSDLKCGGWQIEAKPWEPEEGEKYFYPDFSCDDMVDSLDYEPRSYHNYFLARGLCYKTKEEAIARAKRMLEAK